MSLHAKKIIVGAHNETVTLTFIDDWGREMQRIIMSPELAKQVSDLLLVQIDTVQRQSGGVIDLIRNVDIIDR